MSTASSVSTPVRFADLGVPRPLAEILEKQGIVTAFPIQEATLPDCLAGRDVSGKAPTGAGKTLAFALTVLARLSGKQLSRKGRRQPSALILVPTRELAAQIEAVMVPLAKVVGAQVATIYGGVGYGGQIAALRRGVDVLVACPGRLTDLLDRGTLRLSHVEVVVVDEADRMADMGFLPAVRNLLDMTSPERQTLLFSATLDGPVDKLIRDYQRDPVRYDVQSEEADRGEVSHHFWKVESHDRADVTARVVNATGPAVVFCRTKRGADRLSERLSRSGLASAAIHGNLSQRQRDRALASFRAGRLDVLVATDIAARGIHVDAVPLVVHFDPPADATDYIHRSGRTGRAGLDGTVLSLVGSEHAASTRRMQRSLGLANGLSAPDIDTLSSPGAGSNPVLSPKPSVPAGASGSDRSRRQGGGKARSYGPKTTARPRRPRTNGHRNSQSR
jgi:superfamily II DNA/RNA helicase